MPGMRDQFAHFYAPGEDATAAAMKTGLVVPDTNVLLNLYRFQATARDELFGALEKAGERLWIPHQVGLEFHQTRLGVMKEQEDYFGRIKGELDKSVQGFGESVQAFKRRLSLGDDHVKEIRDALAVLGSLVQDVTVRASELNEVRLGEHASDAVLDRIDALFADEKSVGSPMEATELEDARAEAERRGREGIPPGYRDKNKVKGDPAGDYIIWRKVMDEAGARKLPVVFVTGDAKEDWYQREYGLTLGARRELREEMMREAGVPLLIMTTETFLRHAETYLGATVSEKTKDQAKELPSAADVVEVFVRTPKSVLIDWLPSAAAGGRDISDLLLERIASGEIQGHRELRFAMQVLRTRFDGAEMMQRVVEAVNDGQRSGALGREEAAAALSAVTRELQSSVETVTFLSEAKPRAANPAMPMSRAVFEHALRVSPASGDPDEAAQARRTIAMHLDRHQATPDDRDRARAWLREHDEWIGMQRSESQGEPSAEDLRAAPLRARGPLAAASSRRARFSGVLTFRAAFFVLP